MTWSKTSRNKKDRCNFTLQPFSIYFHWYCLQVVINDWNILLGQTPVRLSLNYDTMVPVSNNSVTARLPVAHLIRTEEPVTNVEDLKDPLAQECNGGTLRLLSLHKQNPVSWKVIRTFGRSVGTWRIFFARHVLLGEVVRTMGWKKNTEKNTKKLQWNQRRICSNSIVATTPLRSVSAAC